MKRYLEIKEALITIIADMEPGKSLPSRSNLCEKLETTRTTLDRAIRELEKEGVVYSKKGSGTYAIGILKGKVEEVENWGVIVPNISEETYSLLVRGVENVACRSEVNIILCNSDNNAEKQKHYIERLLLSRVSGFIIVPVVSYNVAISDVLYSALLKSNIPFVLCNRTIEGIHAPSVRSNDFYGGYIATKHLISKGYRSIAYIAQNIYSVSNERCQGYISALMECGYGIDRRMVILPQEESLEGVYRSMEHLLQQEKKPDAVFCFNDKVAIEVCRAVKDSGLKVSEDIGIIGYDNNIQASVNQPPLTSVAFKSQEIGEKAAEVLSKLIDKEKLNSNFNVYLYQPTIIERESCLGKKKIPE